MYTKRQLQVASFYMCTCLKYFNNMKDICNTLLALSKLSNFVGDKKKKKGAKLCGKNIRSKLVLKTKPTFRKKFYFKNKRLR